MPVDSDVVIFEFVVCSDKSDNMLFLLRAHLRARADGWCSGVVGVTEQYAAIYDLGGCTYFTEG